MRFLPCESEKKHSQSAEDSDNLALYIYYKRIKSNKMTIRCKLTYTVHTYIHTVSYSALGEKIVGFIRPKFFCCCLQGNTKSRVSHVKLL